MKTYWWIAVNGASAAASPYALPDTLKVSPRPQVLFGFEDRAEQIRVQKIFLEAPIKATYEEFERLMKDPKVRQIRFADAEPLAAKTIWLVELPNV